jgi:NADH-quinone oxidoreductase subunit M
MFQRTMHYRVGPDVQSRDIAGLDLAVLAPLTAVVVALGVYPHFFLDRSEDTAVAKTAEARAIARPAPTPAAEAPQPGGLPPGLVPEGEAIVP